MHEMEAHLDALLRLRPGFHGTSYTCHKCGMDENLPLRALFDDNGMESSESLDK